MKNKLMVRLESLVSLYNGSNVKPEAISLTDFSEVENLVKEYNALKALVEPARSAADAAHFVVSLCEADYKAGQSANPFEASRPGAVIAHCYAAMSFVSSLDKALTLLPVD